MKTRNKKYGFKKFLVGGMLALSVFSTSFLVNNFENNNVSAVYASYQETQTTISNNDFNSYSTSTTPYNPNSWTFENPANNEKIKSGVINVYDNLFTNNKEKYELETNPGKPAGSATNDSSNPLYKHLMINSYAGHGRAGYTSGSFDLKANSYYSIAVTLKTNDQAKASIYLSGLSDEDVDSNITGISTANEWVTYTLFVKTNEFVAESPKLELWLGGKEQNETTQGAVFFNKVTLTRYSETTFNSNVNSADEKTTKVVSLFNPVYIDNFISNSSFSVKSGAGQSNAIPTWETIESSQDETQITKVISTENYNAEVDTTKNIANPGTNYKTADSNVLFMQNKESGSQGIKSNEFTIKQNELYMISVWAKSDCGVGNGATLMVEQVNEDEEDEDFVAKTATLSTSTSITTEKSTNNWTQYKIFVEGHPLQDTKATLQIWLGTKDSPTTGYVFVDDIEVQNVSYETFTKGSSSNSATYSYNSDNTQFTIVNGNFNIAQKTENTLTYPLKVSNWTPTTDEHYDDEQNLSGVINTNSAQFAILQNEITKRNLNVTVTNPGLTPAQKISGATIDNSTNNVLMIGNTIQTTQSYKSESFSLSTSGYYKLSMLVNTQFSAPLNKNNGAQLKLTNSLFTAVNIENIDTNGSWETYEMYVHVGSNESTFNLTLALNDVQGYAFFDDVIVEDSTEEEFNAAVAGTNKYKAELNVQTNDSFDLHDNSSSALTEVYNWTATDHNNTGSVKYGALDTTKDVSSVFTGIDVPTAPTGNSMLAIQSLTDTHFTMAASQKIDISIDGYYRISVKVKTLNISQEQNKYDDDGNLIEYGATIALNGYEDSFKAINTEKDLVDGFATYEFLIKPSADAQTYVILGLGGENNLASGYVFFDDVKVETLNEATFKQAVENKTVRSIQLGDQKIETDTEEEPTEFSGSEFDWVIVPSLLTSLAIIIAIAGSTIRKFKFTKQPKIKTRYDRRKTVEVDLDKRERIELRNEIIKELNKEYDEIGSEIDALMKSFEAEKAEIEKLEAEKLKAYEEVKQAIIIEREKVTREYNDKLNSTENLTEEDKSKFEKEFKAYIKKLDKRAAEEAKKFNKKDTTIQVLEIRHTQKVKELTERQKYIQEEIERIEREIEEIAKQEEIMWNEYRKAKEEAKKQKLAYMAEKRKAKEEAKLAKAEQAETSNSEENSNTVETTETTEVEIVEPTDDKTE